ncbi:MAG TPA: IS110 family transposase [Polyangiaceae bacterium]|nr:IS110 family transposase [Polyangiaceae bacterium]
MRSVALDLGGKKTTCCEVSNGIVVARATVTAVDGLRELLGPDAVPARVAIEACREAWHVHETLTQWGNDVILVDTTRSKQMGVGQHGRKTDRIDAEVLARAIERGGIPVAHLLSPGRRELRRLIGVRRALVDTRARLIVTARGLAREQGCQLPLCRVEEFSKRARPLVHESLRQLLQPLLSTLDITNQQIENAETALRDVCVHEHVITLLCTAPGVGPLVAAAFVSVIDEAKRFESAHQLESYLGLVPSETSSGPHRRIGSITKKGNGYLRALLVQSAWVIARNKDTSEPLVNWAQQLIERRGRKVSIVAVARKLAGILWSMWKHNSPYDPERLRRSGASLPASTTSSEQTRAASMRRASRKATGKFSCPEVNS